MFNCLSTMQRVVFILLPNLFSFLLAVNLTTHPNWNLLDREMCGESFTDRIIGGEKASLGQFPWMARIGYSQKRKKGTPRFKCAGSLINEMYVLTAAHCVVELDQDVIRVIRLGENYEDDDIDCERNVCAPPVQDFKPSEIIYHKSYQTPRMRNDIALIRLDRPAKITDFVSPICLPHGYLLTSNYDHGDVKFTVAGWGIVDVKKRKTSKYLLHVFLPLVSKPVCQEELATFAPIGSGQICAGGIHGFDSCGGDSGGPLMMPAGVGGPPQYFQIGVVSFGSKECGNAVAAVYTQVSKYMKWILDHMRP